MKRWFEALAAAMLTAPPSVWGGTLPFRPILGSAEPRVPVIQRVVETVHKQRVPIPKKEQRPPTLQEAVNRCVEWQGPAPIRDAAGFAAVYGKCLEKDPQLGIVSIHAPGAPDLLVLRRYTPARTIEHLTVRARGGKLALIAVSAPPQKRKRFTPLRAL